MAENDLFFMDADYLLPNAIDENFQCLECYEKVPRSLLEVHSAQHEDGVHIKKESDAGRGGRAERSESFVVQPYSIKSAQPRYQFLGGLPKTPSVTAAPPQSFWDAGDSSAERKRSIEDLKNNADKYRQLRKKGQLGVRTSCTS